MRVPFAVVLGLATLLGQYLAACGDPQLRPPESFTRRASFDVACEPQASLEAVSRVSRFRLTPVGSSLDVTAGAEIYRGELSDYYLARIRAGELPSTLAERLVPSRHWHDVGSLVVAPAVPLEAGQDYTLVVRSGEQVRLAVRADDPRPFLARAWPPSDALGTGPIAVYCGDEVALEAAVEVELAPDGILAVVEPGAAPTVARRRCVRLTATEPVPLGTWLMPPALVEGHLIDPGPLEVSRESEPGSLRCDGELVRIGPGCADVADDRFTLQSLSVPIFWAIGGGGVDWTQALGSSGHAVVRGLAPSEATALDVTATSIGGHIWEERLTLQTRAPMPHVIINEVLADPVGPEPAQEWVELYNDGSENAVIDGWAFEDAGGSVALDAILLPVGAYMLLVHEDFEPASPVDVPPEEGVLIVRLAKLGDHGLSNTGEPLTLRDAQGRTISRFPASPKPRAGLSVARRATWLADDDAGSFGYHSGIGSSPGRPNQVE